MKQRSEIKLAFWLAMGFALSSLIFSHDGMAQEGGGEGGGSGFIGVAVPKTVPPPRSSGVQSSNDTSIGRGSDRRATRSRRVARAIESAPSGQPPANETRYIQDEVIVRFQRNSSRGARTRLINRQNLLRLDTNTFRLPGVTVHRYRITDGRSVPTIIATLEASAAVVNAQPNYLYELQQSSDQKLKQYANTRLGVQQTHAVAKGDGVKIAIIDTAIDTTHGEFENASIETVDVSDSRGVNVDPHGTSMAGILSADGRLTGVAPDADILGIASFGRDANGGTSGNTWTISEGLEIALQQRARILNLSFAGPADPLLANGMRGAARRDIIPIAAAGNAGADAPPLYPAAYPSVFAITAIDASDNIYNRANQGDYVEFAAPGVQVVTLNNKNGFGVSSGTSVATAYMSGLVALILSRNPSLSHSALGNLLRNVSNDLGPEGRDRTFGYGIPDVKSTLGAGS